MKDSLRTTVVISTLNRPQDVERLLTSLTKQTVQPAKVVVVDQSSNDDTKKAVASFREKVSSKFEVLWVQGAFRSLTKARNLGTTFVETQVATYLDDDVEIGPDYLKQVLRFFENKEGSILGGFPWPSWPKLSPTPEFPEVERPSKLWTAYRKFFRLSYPTHENRWKVLPSFEGTFNPDVRARVQSEWVSGSNFSVWSDLAKTLKFDENLLGYSIGEDLDFPLRVLKERPESVWVDPLLPVIHHASAVARLDSDNLLMMRACHHYYLFTKHWGNRADKILAFLWTRVGFVLMPSIQARKGLLPDFTRLKKSIEIESTVLRSFNRVKKGQFLYKI